MEPCFLFSSSNSPWRQRKSNINEIILSFMKALLTTTFIFLLWKNEHQMHNINSLWCVLKALSSAFLFLFSYLRVKIFIAYIEPIVSFTFFQHLSDTIDLNWLYMVAFHSSLWTFEQLSFFFLTGTSERCYYIYSLKTIVK